MKFSNISKFVAATIIGLSLAAGPLSLSAFAQSSNTTPSTTDTAPTGTTTTPTQGVDNTNYDRNDDNSGKWGLLGLLGLLGLAGLKKQPTRTVYREDRDDVSTSSYKP